MNIKTISTKKVREHISDIIEGVKNRGEIFVFGRRNNPEAILIKFPDVYNPRFSEITNINAYSNSFDFLKDEPNIYMLSDIKKNIKKKYV